MPLLIFISGEGWIYDIEKDKSLPQHVALDLIDAFVL